MRKFARIDGDVVVEFFPTPDYPAELIPEDGDIRSLFHPDIVWVEVTKEKPFPVEGWVYSSGAFSEPEPYKPKQEEVVAENKSTRDAMLDAATRLINPLVDAVEGDVASEAEKAELSMLRTLRIEISRVDLSVLNPTWPVFPE